MPLSWQAVTWVLEFSDAEGYPRLVLISIASHANREGKNSFPSLDTIALEARVSRREAIYCVQTLEEMGELSIKRGIGRGNPNHYEMPHVGRWLEKVHNMHQLEPLKGARRTLKGARKGVKGASNAVENSISAEESNNSKTERLDEPSKARTVRQVAEILSIPEPSKPLSRPEIEAQKSELRRRGYLH